MIEWLLRKKLFRNANHAIWFLASLGFFLFVVICYFYPSKNYVILITPLLVHFPPLIASTVKVYNREPSELYSKDCVWFNATMIVLYLVLFLGL